jgi:hypothetical protein
VDFMFFCVLFLGSDDGLIASGERTFISGSLTPPAVAWAECCAMSLGCSTIC